MPLIDGEKYACQSCIKGHRVSGCTHHDRELHHINPKGRPVKQCEHCRGARKSKSHHAKCDCGEKKDKDKHKDRGDLQVSENLCCCHSGAKCICGGKDSLNLTLDTTRQTLHSARAKPKLTSTQSESTLTVFANGHHKPCHRNNNTAHVSGAPYKLGRPHTLHGAAAFASFTQANNVFGQPEAPAQRSVDTSSLSNNDWHGLFGTEQRSMDSLPMTPLTGSLDAVGIQDALFAQSSTYGNEGNSPSESHLSDTISPQQWSWTNSIAPVNRNFPYGSLSTSPSQDCLPNLDNDWAIPSAGLNNPSWSASDLPLDPSKLGDSITQPISHGGDSNKQSNPGLTTASSSHSETGEQVLFGDLEIKNPQSVASDSLFWEDNPVFRFATSAAPEALRAPTSMPSYFADTLTAKPLGGVPTSMPSSSAGDGNDVFSTPDFSAISIPNTLNDIGANDPWPLDQSNTIFGAPSGFDSFDNWI